MKKSLRYALFLFVAFVAAPFFKISPAAALTPFACTWVQATLNLNCSGTTTTLNSTTLSSSTLWSTSQATPIVIYDASALTFTPQNGGNSYTLLNSAYPGGWNPNPPTVTLNFDDTVSISGTVTTSNYATALADKGLISANYSNTESVDGSGVNNVILNNFGSIGLTTNQISSGRVEVINSDSQVNNFTVNNAGTLSIAQTFFSGFSTTHLLDSCTGTPSTCTAKYSGTSLQDMSVLYADDNTNEFVLNNAASGQVLATGNFANAYYGRADTTINNSGTIGNTNWASTDTIAFGHWSIVAWAGTDYNVAPNTNPDSDIVFVNPDGSVTVEDTSALTITNNVGGTIKGDIIAMDITPLVYAAGVNSSTDPFPDPGSSVLPLAISSSNAGPRDSNIENFGTINGNFYLGSGTHVIDNAAGGTITGNLDVDQRPFDVVFSTPEAFGGGAGTPGGTFLSDGLTDNAGNSCPTAGQSTTDPGCATTIKVEATVVGGQSLTLTNEGTWNGDINIFDQASSVNSITLTGSGFSGNVVAVNGTGSNSLTLNGVTNLASVNNFSFLDLGTSQVTVTPNSTTVTQGVNLVPNATLAMTLFGNGQAGSLTFVGGTASNSLNLQGPTTIVPTIAGIVHNGETFQFTNSVSGPGANEITVQNTSALVTFVDPSGVLTTSVTSPYQVPGISNPGAATLANLLSYTGGNPQLQALGAAVENLTTLGEVQSAGEQLRPSVNGGTAQVPIDIAYAFQSQIDSRLESNLYGALAHDEGWYADADLPVTKPSSYAVENGGWVNALNADDRQQTTAGVSGYDAHSGGLIAGYDHLFNNVLRLGGAFGYATSAINDSVISGNRQDLKTYEGIAYGSYVQPKWYVDASGGVAGLSYNSFRTVNFPGFFDTDTAAYNGLLYSARLDGGYPVHLPFGVVIPVAGVTYAHVEQNAYTESSQNGSGLTVAEQNTDSVRSSLGLKAVFPVSVSSVYTLAFEPHAVWLHEFENTAQIVSAGFVGGNGSFLAIGPTPTREMGDVGAALRFSQPQFGDSLAVSYNAIVRNAYLDQVAMLHARVDF